MPSRATMTWNGDRLIAQVRRAARDAVNETVDAARDDAKATHTWKTDPTIRHTKSGRPYNSDLESQIVSEHASAGVPNPTGSFGYTRRRGFYGLFHEEGTVREHRFPALRPAADREFPLLAERIRRRLKR